jgi:branched-chain amino acid transport system substrate-binding protein
MFTLSKSYLPAAGLAALLAACVAVAPAWAQTCEVKIGAVGPMTGGASAWGLSAKAGTEFAAAVVNQDGGLPMGNRKCQVKVVTFDALYTAAGGAAASNFLASENVHVTMGPVGSPETTGFRPVAKRNGQINFSSSYMRDVMSPEFPLAFHALQAPITWGPLLIRTAKDQFKFNTVMITAPNDQGGTDSGKQLTQLYADVGVKATPEYYQRGTTNFGPLATRIMNANPDAVEMSSVPPADAAILTRQLLEAGYKGAIGSLGGTGSKPILEGAGGPEKLKAFYWLETSPIDHPGVVKMKADYERIMKAPAPDNPLFPVFALAAEVALRGISNAGTDQDVEKIADALRKLTPESRYMGKAGWRGKSLYGGVNQELTFPVGLGLVVDGKKLPVRTVEIPAE